MRARIDPRAMGARRRGREAYLGGRLGGDRGGENGRHGGRAVCARSRVREPGAGEVRSTDPRARAWAGVVPTWTPGVRKKRFCVFKMLET